MRRTGFNNTLAVATLDNATRAADATVDGATVDTVQGRQSYRVATVVVHAGTITDGTHTIEVQHAADDGTGSPDTWEAVPDSHLQGTEPAIGAADDDTVHEVGVILTRRFVRASVTSAGTTSGGTFGALVLLGQPSRPPVSR